MKNESHIEVHLHEEDAAFLDQVQAKIAEQSRITLTQEEILRALLLACKGNKQFEQKAINEMAASAFCSRFYILPFEDTATIAFGGAGSVKNAKGEPKATSKVHTTIIVDRRMATDLVLLLSYGLKLTEEEMDAGRARHPYILGANK